MSESRISLFRLRNNITSVLIQPQHKVIKMHSTRGLTFDIGMELDMALL